MPVIELKVAADSPVKSVAGSIAKHVQEGHDVRVTYIGAGAGHQAAKAFAIARSYVAANGINLAFVPGFGKTMVKEGEPPVDVEKTTLTWTIIKT